MKAGFRPPASGFRSEAPRTWRPPTRRAFVGMIAAAAAALAVKTKRTARDEPQLPRWIGHV